MDREIRHIYFAFLDSFNKDFDISKIKETDRHIWVSPWSVCYLKEFEDLLERYNIKCMT